MCIHTFAYVLVLQPQLPLYLLVGVPDGTRLLEAIHCLLHVVVPKLPEDGDKVAPLCGSIQRMNCGAEGWKKNVDVTKEQTNKQGCLILISFLNEKPAYSQRT